MSYLSDNKGNLSIMRAAFAWLMVNAVVMAWAVLIFDLDNAMDAAIIFGAVSGIATGGKVYQKREEEKSNNNLKK